MEQYSFWTEAKNYAWLIGIFLVVCAVLTIMIGGDVSNMFIGFNPSALIGVVVIIVGIALFLFFSQNH